ncbi:hypothetical protein J437_LFUL000507 [Ladona fulva]|uniref:Uncharacterized protein n=1 Tax=Ladona fulva TaxID=123851 RepID=A0A8K0NU41_LADFU|nr:hypothetical protein J437_LFUL000507 [Ladona fulva]
MLQDPSEKTDSTEQRYANTYRLESKNPFNKDKVMNIIKEVLESELSEVQKYDDEECRKLGHKISQEIRSRVRLLDFDRDIGYCLEPTSKT